MFVVCIWNGTIMCVPCIRMMFLIWSTGAWCVCMVYWHNVLAWCIGIKYCGWRNNCIDLGGNRGSGLSQPLHLKRSHWTASLKVNLMKRLGSTASPMKPYEAVGLNRFIESEVHEAVPVNRFSHTWSSLDQPLHIDTIIWSIPCVWLSSQQCHPYV